MMRPLVAALVLVAVADTPAYAQPIGEKRVSEHETPPPGLGAPKVVVEAARRYVIGFPFLVSVTYENPHALHSAALPDLPLLGTHPFRVGFRLIPVRGGVATERAPRLPRNQYHDEIGLAPGATHRMLVDLYDSYTSLQPGVYQLIVRVARDGGDLESAPVSVELVAPSAVDAQESARLRALGTAVSGRTDAEWRAFAVWYWGTAIPSPSLSVEARQQLALHLFLHRAFFGPDPVARLDPHELDVIVAPHLVAEVMALRLEILSARADLAALQVRADLLARWPGMRKRADDIAAGRGTISVFRKLAGAESPRAAQESFKPYSTP